MSATMTMTMALPAHTATAPTKMTAMTTAPCCPKCGTDLSLPPLHETQAALLAAQRQIDDLQAQVRLLNQKAAAAVDRWADYEDELQRLRAAAEMERVNSQVMTPPSPPPKPAAAAAAAAAAAEQRSSYFLPAGAATRISALLSPRPAKSTPNLKAAPGQSQQRNDSAPPPSTEDLMEALSREQSLRRAAEGRLSDTSREVEELSVQLFEQANEMVATERRARARLEERVEVLERRDVDKRRRLDRLEQAMGRIERVRALLGEGQGRERRSGLEDEDSS
ncbi:hypothetical protein NKR23_g6376 [Pleurostoma richardsiae]|uniref:GDP/GTP exchange factor Sec2 N-terminal domain-containing protein n=1 Tax=Pleurostoma richardsiae TaxID=41990 RepID=A0AA38RQ39_9PEZI|nr:hypothetical protein NKR23_g6376 [Pleurostoma richardsiae]